MAESVDFHALFTQLQTRYPGSGLISELVQIQADRYIVRASIQMGPTALVSGMAAATTVEQAEDQARLRALRMVGIVPLGLTGSSTLPLSNYLPALVNPSVDSTSSTSSPPDPVSALGQEVALPEAIAPAVVATRFTPSLTDQTSPLEQEGFFPGPSEPLAEPGPSEPLPEKEEPEVAAVAKKPSKPKSPRSNGSKSSDRGSFDLPEQAIEPEANTFEADSYEDDVEFTSEPIDLSELIALSDVEMERVGWSKKRGQTHLKQVYGRSTRAELDEEQLLEFLHYLRALPSN